jgi:tetratricopeptide (TPR) repeat protein
VREGAALAAALRAMPPGRRRPVLRWAVPLAAAAVAITWLVLPPRDPVRALGRVDAVPGFDGLPVRADPDSATALADQGMAAYRGGDFARAAALLGSAAVLDPTPAVHFFLGIARLKAGAPDSARAALHAALEPPGNPYAAEARFYLAKAWLSLRQPDSALAQLAVVPPGAAIAARAAALADSVREVRMR